jgi:hypothetical protein
MSTIYTATDEIVTYRWNGETSLTIQSKARGYDDYHMRQASTRMNDEQAIQLAQIVLPEGYVVVSPEDIAELVQKLCTVQEMLCESEAIVREMTG